MIRMILTMMALSGLCLSSLPAAASAKGVHILLWENDNADVSEEMDKWIAVFERKNPGIRITRQHYETETLRSKFLRSSITGDGAELVYGPNDMAGVFVTAGVIRPVGDWLKSDQFQAKTLSMATLQGKVWGVPVSEGNHLMLLYNRKMVPRAPANVEELIRLGQKLADPDRGRYGLAMFQSEPYWFIPILHGFGGRVLDRKGSKVRVTIDTPAMEKALAWLVDLKQVPGLLPAECSYDCARSMFLGEKAPFYISGDWEVNSMRKKLGDNLGIAPLPRIETTGRSMAPMVSGRFLFVNKSAAKDKLPAIRKFIDFVLSRQVQNRLAERLLRIPASVQARQASTRSETSVLARVVQAAREPVPMPPDVEMRAAWDGMRIMVQRAMSGTETVKQAVQTGQRAADEALKALRQTH